ncbi:MAG: 2-octaprenyl-6-methoxyphenyl hydroxylase [Pseudomonadota bacterium]
MADYDIIIIGAGMVGASLACALRGQPLRVALIEAVPFGAATHSSYDARTTALSYGARRTLEGMGLWERLAGQATPIQRIHISDKGRFGFTRLDSAAQGYPAYGYVVENQALGKLFAQAMQDMAHVELICPARVEDLDIDAQRAAVTVNAGARTSTLHARLVVLADGRKSRLRERLGIATSHSCYEQSAVAANVTFERAHQNTAYERFTPSGPLALLPMDGQRCAMVWTLRDEQLDAVMRLDDDAFLRAVQEHFGWRLGRVLKAGARHAYPLVLTRAHELTRARLALVGNAAHTLHPVAGQGFNLGLRDVAAIGEVLRDALRAGQDIGDVQVLERYAQWRRGDHRTVTALTDSLVRLFTSDFALLAAARNVGMVAVDVVPFVKDLLVRQGMGLRGRQPRLARTLPL